MYAGHIPQWYTFAHQRIRLRRLFKDTLSIGVHLAYDETTGDLRLMDFATGELILQLTNQTKMSALSLAGHMRLLCVPNKDSLWVRLVGYQCLITSDGSLFAQELLSMAQEAALPTRVIDNAQMTSVVGARLYLRPSTHENEEIKQRLRELGLSCRRPRTRPRSIPKSRSKTYLAVPPLKLKK